MIFLLGLTSTKLYAQYAPDYIDESVVKKQRLQVPKWELGFNIKPKFNFSVAGKINSYTSLKFYSCFATGKEHPVYQALYQDFQIGYYDFKSSLGVETYLTRRRNSGLYIAVGIKYDEFYLKRKATLLLEDAYYKYETIKGRKSLIGKHFDLGVRVRMSDYFSVKAYIQTVNGRLNSENLIPFETDRFLRIRDFLGRFNFIDSRNYVDINFGITVSLALSGTY